MSQSRPVSLLETVLNTALGWCINMGAQLIVFPLVGLSVSLGTNLKISAIFTVISVARSYSVRRFFNYLYMRGII